MRPAQQPTRPVWLVVPYVLIAASVLIAWSSRGPLLELKAGREAGAKVSTADLEREMRSMRPKVELTPEMKELDVSAEGIAIERAPRRRRLGRGPDAVADAAAYNANMSALKAALLDGYDPTVPPPDTQVLIQLSIQKLQTIDTANQYVQMIGWWRHYWTDQRLSWNPDQFGGIDFVTFAGYNNDFGEIWGPDTLMYESFDTTPIIASQEYSVYPSGSVFVSKPMVHNFPCPMDVKDFPFDVQTCMFTVGSWSYHGFIVDILPRLVDNAPSAVSLATYNEHTEFTLRKVVTDHYSFFYGCCPEPYPLITYKLKLKRAPLPYFNGLLLPLILSTFAGFFAFLINPNAGERIGLGITIVLLEGVLYSIAMDLLPKSMDWTIFSVLYMWSTVVSFMTLIVSVLAVSLTTTTESVNPMSEAKLLKTFTNADADGTGELDENEIKRAVTLTGLKDEKLAIFQRAIEAKEAEIGRRTITFPDWFDIVADVAESDGLAAYHNFMVWGLVKAFNRYERKYRKEQIMRKFEAMRSKTDTLQVQGKISEKETSIPIVDDMGRAFHSSGGEHDPQLADDDAPADVSDMLGRKLTGYVDAVAMAVIPLLYVIVCLVELAPKTAQLYGDDSKTEIIHLDMDTSAYD